MSIKLIREGGLGWRQGVGAARSELSVYSPFIRASATTTASVVYSVRPDAVTPQCSWLLCVRHAAQCKDIVYSL